MDRRGTHSFFWILIVGVCMRAAHTYAWGTYNCDVKEDGLRRIREICSEASSEGRLPFSAIESKLDRVLEFVEEIKTAEDSWLHLSRKSDTVERDLTKHEETKSETIPEDGGNRTEEEGRDRSDDALASRGDLGYQWQDRRDRPNSYDRRNRRERTSDDDLHERVESTDDAVNSTAEGQEEQKEEEEIHPSIDIRRRSEAKDENGPQKGECTAIVVNDHETIGMFYMMSYQHGHCANRNPINEPIRYCLGYCATKTFLERESGLWSQGNDCKSCQPMSFETVRIPLTCDDGFVFEKKFENVVDCKCQRCSPLEDN